MRLFYDNNMQPSFISHIQGSVTMIIKNNIDDDISKPLHRFYDCCRAKFELIMRKHTFSCRLKSNEIFRW